GPGTVSDVGLKCHAVPPGLRSASVFETPLGLDERFDVPPAIRLAVRAHAVRQLGLVAVRAQAHARRLEAVLRATLVAARFRRFLLGNCHEAASIATNSSRPSGWARTRLPNGAIFALRSYDRTMCRRGVAW